MNFIHAPLRAFFDIFLYPFRSLPPIVGLSVVSLVISIAMLFIFKRTSNQKRLDAVKRQIHAGLFEIRLFNDDIRAIFRAQFEVLGHNMNYLRLTLVPMLWMLVPLFLVVAQLQFHYGYAGLVPGQSTLLKVQLDDNWADNPALVAAGTSGRPGITLDVPDGLRVEQPGIWMPVLNEMNWRLTATAPGDHEIGIVLGGVTYRKSARVSDAVVRRAPLRPSSLLDQLIDPAETPLPAAAPIAAILVGYPDGTVNILGWSLHWLIVFFALTMIFAFALRKPLGVTI